MRGRVVLDLRSPLIMFLCLGPQSSDRTRLTVYEAVPVAGLRGLIGGGAFPAPEWSRLRVGLGRAGERAGQDNIIFMHAKYVYAHAAPGPTGI